jgi:hypothetical protein
MAKRSHLVKPRFLQDFNYKVLEIRDAQDQNLIRIFPECEAPLSLESAATHATSCSAKNYIDQALAMNGRILVHCGDGISRSPAIVTAYVMCTQNLSTEDAFQYVQARRFCISPNQGFQHQIEAYQHIYEAAQQCAQDPALNSRASEGRKRIAEEDDEAEMMDASMSHLAGNRLVSKMPVRNVHRRINPQEEVSNQASPFVFWSLYAWYRYSGLITAWTWSSVEQFFAHSPLHLPFSRLCAL